MPRDQLASSAILIVAALLSGCATHVAYRVTGPDDKMAAIIRSVGDTDFYIYRRPDELRPTPYVMRINGQETSRDPAPTSVSVPAGTHKLIVMCRLPPKEAHGTAIPFRAEGDGIGNIVTGGGGALAHIPLTGKFEAGKSYELRCDSLGNLRARAWLTESH